MTAFIDFIHRINVFFYLQHLAEADRDNPEKSEQATDDTGSYRFHDSLLRVARRNSELIDSGLCLQKKNKN